MRVAVESAIPSGGSVRAWVFGPAVKKRVHDGHETFIDRPTPGRWRIVVDTSQLRGSSFRVRAKLEPAAEPGKKVPMLPDLAMDPPYDFTFASPVVFAGPSAASCNPDETVEDQVVRCLRFTLGLQNRGVGPFELRFDAMGDAGGEHDVFQSILYGDGSVRERRIGTYEFHPTHGHYHYSGLVNLELFSVTNLRRGGLSPEGEVRKLGYCMFDVRMNSWHRFIHQVPGYARSTCAEPGESWTGLSAGWTDVYDWFLSDNYVDFTNKPDGVYLIRVTVDDIEEVIESDYSNNSSFALVRITGDEIEVLAKGYGDDPWADGSATLTDWWEKTEGYPGQ